VLAESSAAWPKGDHVLAAASLPGTPPPSRRTQEGPPNQKAYPCIDHTSLKAAGRPACGAVQTASPAEGRPVAAARILRDFVSLPTVSYCMHFHRRSSPIRRPFLLLFSPDFRFRTVFGATSQRLVHFVCCLVFSALRVNPEIMMASPLGHMTTSQ